MTDMVKFGKQFLKATFTTFCDLPDIRTKSSSIIERNYHESCEERSNFCKEALSKKS